MSNKSIREITEVNGDIFYEIQKRQLIWYGHASRIEEFKRSNKILGWTPAGRRKRGRSKRSWKDI